MKSTRSKSPDATLGGIRCGRTLSIFVLVLGLVVWAVEPGKARPASTAFTYQGRLIDANDVAWGEYDFQFKLFDSPADEGASCSFRLDLANYKVDVQTESGYVYIYDLNEALLFRLGGYEQFCFDCFGDVFDKESLPHTLQQTTYGDITTLTFNVSNPAIDLTQIYEFDDSSFDFDYTFYYTFKKDMKMRDQLFLMDYNEAYINNIDIVNTYYL